MEKEGSVLGALREPDARRHYLGRGRLACGEPSGDSWLTHLLPRAPVHPAELLAGARPLLFQGSVVLSAVAAGLFQA